MVTEIARYNRNYQKDLPTPNRRSWAMGTERQKDRRISGVKGRLLGGTDNFVFGFGMYSSDSCFRCKLMSH